MNPVLKLANAARNLDPGALVFPVKPASKTGAWNFRCFERNDAGDYTWQLPIPLLKLKGAIERGVELLGYSPPPGVVVLDLDNPSKARLERIAGALGGACLCAYDTPGGGRHYWVRIRGADIERLPRKWRMDGEHVGDVIKPGLHYAAVHDPLPVAEAIPAFNDYSPASLEALSKIIDLKPEPEAKPATVAGLADPAMYTPECIHMTAPAPSANGLYDTPGEGDVYRRMDGYRAKLIRNVEGAGRGSRNETLNKNALALAKRAAHYGLGRDYLDPLGDASVDVTGPRDDWHTQAEARATLDSAWSAGSAKPLPLEERSRLIPPRASKGASKTSTAPSTGTSTSTGPGATVIPGFPLKGPTVILENAGRNPDTLERVLEREGFDIRYNLRGRDEWKWRAEPESAWQSWDRRVRARLFTDIKRKYRYKPVYPSRKSKDGTSPLLYGKDLREDAVNAILHLREVDPFLEWLRSLPPWDRVPRLGLKRGTCWLSELFGAEDTPLNRWAARVLFIGAVKRTLEPGYRLREMPVFVGEQNLGKSAMLRALLPTFDPRFFGDSLLLNDPNGQRQVEATLGVVIMEVSEMAGVSKADLEKLKAYITRLWDKARLAWGYDVGNRPRRFILAGTANPGTPLPNDPSGNSRFVTVELPGFPNRDTGRAQAREAVESYWDQRRIQYWAEGYYRVRVQGEIPNLPRELALDQDAANEPYRNRDDILEDQVAAILAGLDLDSPDDQLTTEQWADKIRERRVSKGYSQTVHRTPLRRALQAIGLKTKRTRRGDELVYVWIEAR